jgi:hypothetical protein
VNENYGVSYEQRDVLSEEICIEDNIFFINSFVKELDGSSYAGKVFILDLIKEVILSTCIWFTNLMLLLPITKMSIVSIISYCSPIISI